MSVGATCDAKKLTSLLWKDGQSDRFDMGLWQKCCTTIKNVLEDTGDQNDVPIVPLPNISRTTGLAVNYYLCLLDERLGARAGQPNVEPNCLQDCWDPFPGNNNVKKAPNHDVDIEQESMSDEENKPGRSVFRFEMEFLHSLQSDSAVFALADAANYLDCNWLIDATAQYVCDIADKAIEQSVIDLEGKVDGQRPTQRNRVSAQIAALKAALNIEKDFTSDEEREMHTDAEWKYDDGARERQK